MDFSELTNDELADVSKALFDELHVRLGNLPQGSLRNGVARRLGIAHRAMDVLREYAQDGGIIQPLSGGDPKPDGD